MNQNVLKSDMENPGFVPFGANLTHFGPKSHMPDESVLAQFLSLMALMNNEIRRRGVLWSIMFLQRPAEIHESPLRAGIGISSPQLGLHRTGSASSLIT